MYFLQQCFKFQDINKKYPGFIHMKLLQGIQLSFNLQKIVQGRIVRGYRIKHENELPSALNGFLYSILKSTKSQRRGILNSLLKQFDDTSVRMINKKTVKEENKNYDGSFYISLFFIFRKTRCPKCCTWRTTWLTFLTRCWMSRFL